MLPIQYPYGQCWLYKDCQITYQNRQLKVYYKNTRLLSHVNRSPENKHHIKWSDTFLDESDTWSGSPIDCNITNGFLFHDDWQFQYGHYLLDTFPRIRYFEDILQTAPDTKLLQIVEVSRH